MGLYTLYIQKDSLLEGIFVSEILFVGLKLDSREGLFSEELVIRIL